MFEVNIQDIPKLLDILSEQIFLADLKSIFSLRKHKSIINNFRFLND